MTLGNFTPPASVRQIGDPRWRRFVIRDGGGKYWTGRAWSDRPGRREALSTRIRRDAGSASHPRGRQGTGSVQGNVVVSAKRGEWTLADLIKYLKRWGRFLLMKSQETRAIKVEIHWDGLEADDGEAEWTRRGRNENPRSFQHVLGRDKAHRGSPNWATSASPAPSSN